MPGQTPRLQIPYPLPAEAVTDYPTTGQQLALKLEGLGLSKLWDSTEAGVIFPVAQITPPTLPSTFKHLLIPWVARADAPGTLGYLWARQNGAASGYYNRIVQGSASGATAPGTLDTGGEIGYCPNAGAAAGALASGILFIADYARALQHYTLALSASAWDGTYQNQFAGLFSSVYSGGSPAITSLTFLPAAGNFVGPTRFSIYGIN